MKSILIRICWVVFAVIVVLFIFSLTPLRDRLSGSFEIFPGIPFILLGIALIVIAIASKMHIILKVFLIVTGASAIGWPGSLFLHNFLYQYFPTEPVTYILFFMVFPVTFIIGGAGSIVTGLIARVHVARKK
jgi:hypothetical protein